MKTMTGLGATRPVRVLSGLLLAAGLVLGAPLSAMRLPETVVRPPVVFVHGNGDTAATWITTQWRFESNGWPRERLHAVDQPLSLARSLDDRPEPFRSSTAEHLAFLSAEVDAVLARTGADKVVLIGNSRGGNVIRHYVRQGGAAKVSHAILGGTPNHGVFDLPDFAPGSEFNGSGPFLKFLNTPQGPQGEEVTPGVQWMTLRSDGSDKFGQPTGEWIGRPGQPTGVTHDTFLLRGAENVVLPGADHRETSYSPQSFAQVWRFLTGAATATLEIAAEERVVLDGRVQRWEGATITNLPLAGARVEVWSVECATGVRQGAALLSRTTGDDGRWGPLVTTPTRCHEFVVEGAGLSTAHYYRAPFPRSSSLVHLRSVRGSDLDRTQGAVVMMTRPRGYFGPDRDRMSLDGAPLPGLRSGVPGVSSVRLPLAEGGDRTVEALFNGQRVAVRLWPAREGHLSIAELHD